jgi:hypothetical protein
MLDFGVKAGAQETGRGIEKEDIEYTLEVVEKVARQIRDKR